MSLLITTKIIFRIIHSNSISWGFHQYFIRVTAVNSGDTSLEAIPGCMDF